MAEGRSDDYVPVGDGFCAPWAVRWSSLGMLKGPVRAPTGRMASFTHGVLGFFLRCRSVELDLNQAHVEDTPKRKGIKVFGSLERGLDKVITVLTRSKRKGSAKDGPRRLKVSGLEFFNMDF